MCVCVCVCVCVCSVYAHMCVCVCERERKVSCQWRTLHYTLEHITTNQIVFQYCGQQSNFSTTAMLTGLCERYMLLLSWEWGNYIYVLLLLYTTETPVKQGNSRLRKQLALKLLIAKLNDSNHQVWKSTLSISITIKKMREDLATVTGSLYKTS